MEDAVALIACGKSSWYEILRSFSSVALTIIANCVVSAGNNGGVGRLSIGTSPMTRNDDPEGEES